MNSLSVNARAMFFIAVAVVLSVLVVPAPAHAAVIQDLDVTDLISSIGIVIAAVTSIGMGALSIALVVRAFKYIRTAF